MFRSFFAQSPVLAMPLAALVIFMVVFVALAARALARRGELNAAAAAMPLDDGEEGRAHG